MAHTNQHYKARWLRAFAPASGVLRCVGALDGARRSGRSEGGEMGRGSGNGGACGVGAALDRLHLDHERPLHATCHRWRAAMPAAPRSCGTTGWTAGRCATTCLGFARARRTAPRVCGFLSVRPAARRRGGGAAVCGPRVLPSVIAGVVGVELVERFLDPREFVLGGLGVCVCAFRVCVCVCV